MALTITDEIAERDARRLARLTGQSVTAAVRGAIADRLQQVERRPATLPPAVDPDALLDAARHCRDALPAGMLSADHAALYGEDGLPD